MCGTCVIVSTACLHGSLTREHLLSLSLLKLRPRILTLREVDWVLIISLLGSGSDSIAVKHRPLEQQAQARRLRYLDSFSPYYDSILSIGASHLITNVAIATIFLI